MKGVHTSTSLIPTSATAMFLTHNGLNPAPDKYTHRIAGTTVASALTLAMEKPVSARPPERNLTPQEKEMDALKRMIDESMEEMRGLKREVVVRLRSLAGILILRLGSRVGR